MMRLFQVGWTVLFLGLGMGSVRAGAEPTDYPDLSRVDWTRGDGLEALLTQIHGELEIPAIGAAVFKDGKVLEHATVGVREIGSPDPVSEDARFHLGSLTKSFTAALLGKLVEQGRLRWESRLCEFFEDHEMHEAYRDVTLEQLLQHRGGFPAVTQGLPEGVAPREDRGTPRQTREAFLAEILARPPTGTPGETVLYSNAGYSLAGHVAERLGGQTWEDLVRRYLFGALEMKTAGFGFPEFPRGHVGKGPGFIPVPPESYPPMDFIAPAGNIHCSVSDLARYGIFHLAGLHGRDGVLKSATLKRIHTPLPGGSGMVFASGWIVSRGPGGEEVHSHGGTVGASYAEIKLYPKNDFGVVALMTVPRRTGEVVASRVMRALLERHGGRGFFSRSDSREVPLERVEGKGPEDEKRYWEVAEKLAHAINDEDRDAYRELFSPASDEDSKARDEMFDFMARSVLPARGGIRWFHALSPAMKVEFSSTPIRVAVFHLENGFPGYFILSLDEEGKVDHFSLFVKSELCPNGPDRSCDKNVRDLAKEASR